MNFKWSRSRPSPRVCPVRSPGSSSNRPSQVNIHIFSPCFTFFHYFNWTSLTKVSKNKPEIIYSTHLLNENSAFSVRRFMSQLDMILITIFLILLFILIIAIISFVIYKRSTSLSKRNKNKNYKDMADEWGFQSSSSPAATATFLSSSSTDNVYNNMFKIKS